MTYPYPEKSLLELKSLIRAVTERGSNIPGFISFALGSPAPECIPVDLMRQAYLDVFDQDPMAVLAYGPQIGDIRLRNWIIDYMAARQNCPSVGQDVVMLTGSGQGLRLAPHTLCDDGDEVYLDLFTYPNATYAAHYLGAKPVAIEGDDDGMLPDKLEEAARSKKGKLIYLIPNFQNATGRTMPLKRRKEIYEVAKKYHLAIYEDDPYGEIRFSGDHIPSFKSFDSEDLVIYSGSFSKTLSAGLRVGFLFGPEAMMKKITAVKNTDGQAPLYNQKIIFRALELIDLDAHIRQLRETYGRKCRLMEQALKSSGSSQCRILVPDGGMFMWVEIPETVDIDAMSDAMIEAGVGPVKSAAFTSDLSRPGHAFRLNYSAPSETDIEKGASLFGQVTRLFCGD